ncbi:MAG: rRNA maturation RNase YbeY [Pseudomonadota bacterium]|nr:rRNA maturation RNase YbeY [Pseudomonadota bacterium]
MDIAVQLHHPRWKTLLRPYCKTVREACQAALAATRQKGEIAVVLADDAFVRDLNKTYRGRDKPTNVLSFPGDGDYLGDIILALETVEREAREQGKTARDHAKHLLVHGTLHLLGYDHEREGEARRMEALEIKILRNLSVANPYLSDAP